LFNKAVSSVIGSVIGYAIGPVIGFVIGSVAGLKCSTRGQLSFKVGEGAQSTAVKDSYLSVLS